MGSDGLVRIVLCVALAAFGFQSAGYYGMAVAISPLFGVAYIASRGNLRTDPGPDAAWAEVTPNLGWLLHRLGVRGRPAQRRAGAHHDPRPRRRTLDSLVTAFSYGVLLARIPLFMFQAVQAALLPRLSRLAASGNFVEFRAGLRRLLMLVVAVGVIGSLGALALGPFVLKKVYAADLAGTTLAILAAGSALYMLAISLAQAIIALKGHKLVAAGWVIATVALALGTWLGSDDVFRRVEIGLLVSSVAAVASFAVMLWFAPAVGRPPRRRFGARGVHRHAVRDVSVTATPDTIAVVVLTFRPPAGALEACVDSVLRSGDAAAVYVVDNGRALHRSAGRLDRGPADAAAEPRLRRRHEPRPAACHEPRRRGRGAAQRRHDGRARVAGPAVAHPRRGGR